MSAEPLPTVQDLMLHSYHNTGNEKGPVFNLDFSELGATQGAVFYRTQGIVAEGHFHTGRDPSYDPQTLVVLKGAVKFTFQDSQGGSKEVVVRAFEQISIPKMVVHGYEILQDTIFMEFRKTPFNSQNLDLYHHTEFKKMVESYYG